MDAATCKALGFREDGIADLSALGLSTEAIEARRKFIGGSDATIIHKNDPEAVHKLAAFKRGEREADDLSDLIYVQLANWTEPFLLAWAEKILHCRVTRRGERVVDMRRAWRVATLDGWMADFPGGPRVLQCKHVVGWTKPDELIETYYAQVQHELSVTKAPAALLVALFGTQQFQILEIEPDFEFQDQLLAAEEAFWQAVETGSDTTLPAILAKAKPAKLVRLGEVSMEGNNLWADAAQRWLDTRDAAKAFEVAKDDLKKATPPDAKRAYGHGVEVTASKSGSLTVREMRPTQIEEAA